MVNQNGAIVPSTEDLNKAVSQLLNGIKGDDKVNVHFRTSPVDYFRAIGIATDGIPELMVDLGLQAESAYVNQCRDWSCFFSGCAITCWFTSFAVSTPITLKATANPLKA